MVEEVVMVSCWKGWKREQGKVEGGSCRGSLTIATLEQRNRMRAAEWRPSPGCDPGEGPENRGHRQTEAFMSAAGSGVHRLLYPDLVLGTLIGVRG